ncbi:chaperone protein dnaj 1, mitochondrial [Fagus crenata]
MATFLGKAPGSSTGFSGLRLTHLRIPQVKLPVHILPFALCIALQGEILCGKLKACGFGQLRSSPAGAALFNDISSPASIHEVALRSLWAGLPMELLQLAFSNYKFLEGGPEKVALEFLVVPDLPQLPPFFLRRPSCRSISGHRKCSEILLLCVPYFLFLFYIHYMSIVTATQKKKQCFTMDHPKDNVFKDEKFDNLIFKVPEKKQVPNGTVETVGPELFDHLRLTELRFDASVKKFGPNELKHYNDLKEPMVQMAR